MIYETNESNFCRWQGRFLLFWGWETNQFCYIIIIHILLCILILLCFLCKLLFYFVNIFSFYFISLMFLVLISFSRFTALIFVSVIYINSFSVFFRFLSTKTTLVYWPWKTWTWPLKFNWPWKFCYAKLYFRKHLTQLNAICTNYLLH